MATCLAASAAAASELCWRLARQGAGLSSWRSGGWHVDAPSRMSAGHSKRQRLSAPVCMCR